MNNESERPSLVHMATGNWEACVPRYLGVEVRNATDWPRSGGESGSRSYAPAFSYTGGDQTRGECEPAQPRRSVWEALGGGDLQPFSSSDV